MSEETNLSAPVEAPAPAASVTTPGSTTTRKKAPAKVTAATRRARQLSSTTASRPVFGGAALASCSRARNPSLDDPFQSGLRIWPD